MGESRNKQWQIIRARQRRILVVAYAVAEAMFLVEIATGLIAMSVVLQMDALETTETDAATDAVLGWPVGGRYGKTATFFGGVCALIFCTWIVAAAVWHYLEGTVPDASLMAAVGAAALAANGLILFLLRHDRGSGENTRSAWRSARNDAIGNGVVIAAAGGVYATGQAWPDILAAGVVMPFAIRQAIMALRSS